MRISISICCFLLSICLLAFSPLAAIASDGESNSQSSGSSSQLSEIKKFVLLNYSHIAHELVFGEDQYISALLEMIKTKPIHRQQVIANMRKSLAKQKSIYLFANEITQNVHF